MTNSLRNLWYDKKHDIDIFIKIAYLFIYSQ